MFTLPVLPFDKTALEPAMSATTLETHHGKHHAGYVKKTNALLQERSDAPAMLEEVVRRAARDKDTSLFNNAAQAWNHAFFWNCLSSQPQEPQGELRRAIDRSFDYLDSFRVKAHECGAGHFASGWLWLVAAPDGSLALHDLHDAQTPLVEDRATPLLVCDLWEHAYYLDYKNDRGSFLRAFLNQLANWRFAESQYEAATSQKGAWRYPS